MELDFLRLLILFLKQVNLVEYIRAEFLYR